MTTRKKVAGAALLALLLAGSAAAAPPPEDRGSPWVRLRNLIALLWAPTSTEGGPFVDPDGLAAPPASDSEPVLGPNGSSTAAPSGADGGPVLDPNG